MPDRIKAVLFDVGGPLDKEAVMDRLIDEQITASFRASGIEISNAEYRVVSDWAVSVFAPKTYHSIIWKIADGDIDLAKRVEIELMETVESRNRARDDFELRPGIPELLEDLSGNGLSLGLAANQPRKTLDNMKAIGILRYFEYQGVSGSIGLRKPDPRLLLHACQALKVGPNETILIGDRIDNDIVPAKTLGMPTIRFVSGRHAAQEPRSWYERPDTEVESVEELKLAIYKILSCPPNIYVDDGPE